MWTAGVYRIMLNYPNNFMGFTEALTWVSCAKIYQYSRYDISLSGRRGTNPRSRDPKSNPTKWKEPFRGVKRKPRVLITSIPHHFNFRPNAANRIFKCEHSPNKCAGIISQLQPIKANLLPRGIVSGNRDTPQKRFQSRENITTQQTDDTTGRSCVARN